MRYIILLAPATVLLFSILTNDAIYKMKNEKFGSVRPGILIAVLSLSSVGFLLEIAAGIKSAMSYDLDLIAPLLGRF